MLDKFISVTNLWNTFSVGLEEAVRQTTIPEARPEPSWVSVDEYNTGLTNRRFAKKGLNMSIMNLNDDNRSWWFVFTRFYASRNEKSQLLQHSLTMGSPLARWMWRCRSVCKVLCYKIWTTPWKLNWISPNSHCEIRTHGKDIWIYLDRDRHFRKSFSGFLLRFLCSLRICKCKLGLQRAALYR